MKRKELVLFMIVGTGINSNPREIGFKLLAKKLYSTITKIYPNYVVFFASSKSKQTINYIGELFAEEGDEFVEEQDYQIVPVEAIDDFSACFEILNQKYGNLII